MAFGGVVKLTGESEYKKALKQISQNLREVSSEAKIVTSNFDKNDKSITALTAKQGVLNKKLAEQSEKLKTISTQYDKYADATAKSAKEHQALGNSLQTEKAKLATIEAQVGKNTATYNAQKMVVDALEKEYEESSKAQDKNAQSLSNLRIQMNNAQADVNKTAREVDDLGQELEDSKKNVDVFGRQIEDAGKKAENASTGGFTVFKGIIADLGARAVETAINGLKQLGSALVDVGKQAISSYASYEQLIGGVETLFKDNKDMVEQFANNAYKTAGLSANEYMETVTSFSASLLQSLGQDTEKSAKYADLAITDMADNANKMGTSIGMIQNAYQGFAKQNYTMLDNLKLGYGGTKTEMERLIEDANKIKEANGQMADLTIEDFSDVIEAIHIMQTEMGITGTTAKEASSTIEGSTASMKASWQNLLTGIASGDQDIGELVDNFVEALLTAGENLAPRIKEVIEGIKEVISKVWTDVLPELAEEIPELGNLIDAFTWIKDNSAVIISAIAGITAGFVAFKVAGQITSLVSGFQTFFSTVQSGQGIMAGLNAVMSANPLGLIAMAVAGLVTAFITLWNTSEGFRNFWIGMWENIKEAFGNAWQAISEGLTNAWNNITEGFTTAKESVIKVWGDITNWFSEKWEGIKETFSNVGTWFTEKFTEAWEGIKSVFRAIPEWFSNKFTEAWEAVKRVFSTGGKIFDGIKEGIAETFKKVVNAIIRGINRVIAFPFNKINGMLNKIRNASFLGISPFASLWGENPLPVPQIPELAKGAVLKRGQVGLLEGNGAEAVVPLERNTQWIKRVANELADNMPNGQYQDTRRMTDAFKQALSEMKIELDDEVAGRFVERTVARAVFS